MLNYRTLAFLMAFLVPLAAADHDLVSCETEEADVDTGDTPAGRYYIVNDECQPDCIFSVWIFQESNGRDGLQRSDEVQDCDDGDTIIF